MKYTRFQLFDFIARADTPEKIRIAEKWITKNVEDNELWEDLMAGLSMQSREYYLRKNAE